MIFKTQKGSDGTTILLRLSTKCSSNCKFCELPYLEENIFNKLRKLEDILDFCDNNCDNNFIIGILGFNLLDSDKYSNFYNLSKKYNKFKYSIQLGQDDLLFRFKKIIKLSKEINNIDFGIQKIIYKKEDIIGVIKSINILVSNSININISYILNFNIFSKFINLLIEKYNYNKNEMGITFYIGDSVVEFENDLGFNDINKFGFNKCVALDNFYIENNDITIQNDIEITLDGDIKFHLNNFCNQGIEKISSIYNSRVKILEDFVSLKDILIKNDNSIDRCKKCLKEKINIL